MQNLDHPFALAHASTLPAPPHEMAIMGKEGDTKVMWDPANEPEVENARRSFEYLQEQGYMAFSVLGEAQDRLLEEFDPDLAVIIFIPPMQAG